MPSLNKARQAARRTVCAAGIKDGVRALILYAQDQGKGKFPLGAMGQSSLSAYQNGNGWSQLDYMYEYSYEPLKSYLKDTRNMMCNSIPANIKKEANFKGEPFIPSWNVVTGWKAYWIGYNYLGGHFSQAWPSPVSQAEAWTSPYRITDSGKLALLVDKVNMSTRVYNTYIAHSERGMIQAPPATEPKVASPRGGGSVGNVDGSVAWKFVTEMKKHHGQKNFEGYRSPIVFGYW
jgi:hypothetical protein